MVRELLPNLSAPEAYDLCKAYEEFRDPKTIVSFYKSGSYNCRAAFDNTANRISEIREFCVSRGITKLVHFTRCENLSSILRLGILDRRTLSLRVPQEKIHINDQKRLDQFLQAISVSISYPNYKLFFRYQKQIGGSWVVLILKPDILWEFDCAFCSENAAAKNVTSIGIDKRRNPNHLREMFGNFKNHKNTVKRNEISIPNNFTTNPQAEVLVFSSISPKMITEVYFQDQNSHDEWLAINGLQHNIEFMINGGFFSPRVDYPFWKGDNESKVEDELPF